MAALYMRPLSMLQGGWEETDGKRMSALSAGLLRVSSKAGALWHTFTDYVDIYILYAHSERII